MTYNLNQIPTHNGKPHGIDYPMAQYIAEQLEARVSTSNPLLEYTIAQQLRATGEVSLTEEERDYLVAIISSWQIDNLFKGQILERFK